MEIKAAVDDTDEDREKRKTKMYHQSDESDLDGRERRSERYNSYGFGVDVDGNVVVKVEGEFVIPSCGSGELQCFLGHMRFD